MKSTIRVNRNYGKYTLSPFSSSKKLSGFLEETSFFSYKGKSMNKGKLQNHTQAIFNKKQA